MNKLMTMLPIVTLIVAVYCGLNMSHIYVRRRIWIDVCLFSIMKKLAINTSVNLKIGDTKEMVMKFSL
jgi:hypothetical protein